MSIVNSIVQSTVQPVVRSPLDALGSGSYSLLQNAVKTFADESRLLASQGGSQVWPGGQQFTVSFWAKWEGVLTRLFECSGSTGTALRFLVQRNSSNSSVTMETYTAAPATLNFKVDSNAGTAPIDGNWHHYLIVCDLVTGVGGIYVDGSINAAASTATAGTTTEARDSISIFGRFAGQNTSENQIAQLGVWGEYINDVDKFINTDVTPIAPRNLGYNGSRPSPSGIPALIYFGGNAEDANFGRNRGSIQSLPFKLIGKGFEFAPELRTAIAARPIDVFDDATSANWTTTSESGANTRYDYPTDPNITNPWPTINGKAIGLHNTGASDWCGIEQDFTVTQGGNIYADDTGVPLTLAFFSNNVGASAGRQLRIRIWHNHGGAPGDYSEWNLFATYLNQGETYVTILPAHAVGVVAQTATPTPGNGEMPGDDYVTAVGAGWIPGNGISKIEISCKNYQVWGPNNLSDDGQFYYMGGWRGYGHTLTFLLYKDDGRRTFVETTVDDGGAHNGLTAAQIHETLQLPVHDGLIGGEVPAGAGVSATKLNENEINALISGGDITAEGYSVSGGYYHAIVHGAFPLATQQWWSLGIQYDDQPFTYANKCDNGTNAVTDAGIAFAGPNKLIVQTGGDATAWNIGDVLTEQGTGYTATVVNFVRPATVMSGQDWADVFAGDVQQILDYGFSTWGYKHFEYPLGSYKIGGLPRNQNIKKGLELAGFLTARTTETNTATFCAPPPGNDEIGVSAFAIRANNPELQATVTWADPDKYIYYLNNTAAETGGTYATYTHEYVTGAPVATSTMDIDAYRDVLVAHSDLINAGRAKVLTLNQWYGQMRRLANLYKRSFNNLEFTEPFLLGTEDGNTLVSEAGDPFEVE